MNDMERAIRERLGIPVEADRIIVFGESNASGAKDVQTTKYRSSNLVVWKA